MLKFICVLTVASCASAVPHYSGAYGHYRAAPLVYAAAAPAVVKTVVPAEPIYAPQPYSFGYDTVDEYGTRQNRQETSDANNVKTGSYGYTDANGIYRQVNYIADEHGFRATISTNEPGTAPGESANAVYDAKPISVKPVAKAVAASAAYLAPAYVEAPSYAHGTPLKGYIHGIGYKS